MSPLPFSSGTSSASASFTGLEVIAPNMAASLAFSRSMVRWGKDSPSLHQNSQPMSPWVYLASNFKASRQILAASMTSTPTPSPGNHAMLYWLMIWLL